MPQDLPMAPPSLDLDAFADPVVLLDARGRLTAASSSLAPHLGREGADLHGRAFADLLLPAQRPALQALLDDLRRGQEPAPLNLALAGAEGRALPAQLTLRALRREDRCVGFQGLLRLESRPAGTSAARPEQAQRLHLLAELARLLQSGQPEAQLRAALSLLLELAGAEEGALYLMDGDGRLRRMARRGAPDLFPALLATQPGVSLPASFLAFPRLLEARSPVGRPGILERLRERGRGQGLLLPLPAQGRLQGVAVLAAGQEPLDAELRALLTQAGALLGMARDGRLLREEVRELKLRFEDMSQGSVDHIWEVDAQGRYVYNSEGVTQLLGYRPEELKGRRPLDFTHPDDRERLATMLDEIRELKQPLTDFVHRALSADGGEVFLESRAFPVLGAHGELLGYRGVDHNITDWFQARRIMEETLIGTCEALGRMVELRDPYTKGHSVRVAALAVFLGERLGRSSYELQGLRLMGLLHDIGKVGIPTEILSKPGRLDPEELEIMRQHPRMGHEILKDISFPWPVSLVVLHHHERLDGSGYPLGLDGAELMWQVRLLAVADLLEAMSTDRPYRPGLGLELSLRELGQNRGLLYDPEIVDVVLAAAATGELQAHLDRYPLHADPELPAEAAGLDAGSEHLEEELGRSPAAALEPELLTHSQR